MSAYGPYLPKLINQRYERNRRGENKRDEGEASRCNGGIMHVEKQRRTWCHVHGSHMYSHPWWSLSWLWSHPRLSLSLSLCSRTRASWTHPRLRSRTRLRWWPHSTHVRPRPIHRRVRHVRHARRSHPHPSHTGRRHVGHPWRTHGRHCWGAHVHIWAGASHSPRPAQLFFFVHRKFSQACHSL